MAARVVRHSELRDFRQCPLKHRLRWTEGWREDGASPASALGTAWHAVLQAHYELIQGQQRHHGYTEWARLVRDEQQLDNVGALHSGVYEAGWDQLEDESSELSDEQDATLRWMYEGYIERFGVDLDWEVLHVEEEMGVRLRNPDGSPTPYWYQWHCDLAVRDHSMGGRVIVVDHKSTGQPLGQVDVDLDDQFGLYAWAFTQLGYDVLAPVCNQAQTKQLKRAMTLQERFIRLNSYRSLIEQHNIAQDALATAKAIYAKANRDMPYSAPDPRSCGWKCEFKETHIQMRKDPRYLGAARAALVARGFHQEDTHA